VRSADNGAVKINRTLLEDCMEQSTISLVIADDHPLILAGIATLIESEPSFELLGQAVDAVQAVEQYERLRPDVLLIDLNMPGGGLEAIAQVKAMDADAKIVILTTYEGDEDVHRGLRAGASAYLLKQAGFEEIVHCVRQVADRRRYLPPVLVEKLAARINANQLSKRELDILAHLSAGKSNKIIARDAGIGIGTVKYHINNILSKLNVSCRTEAASVAQKRGLLHPF
jgi:DNA-binding NarL/FixJ family response regulator